VDSHPSQVSKKYFSRVRVGIRVRWLLCKISSICVIFALSSKSQAEAINVGETPVLFGGPQDIAWIETLDDSINPATIEDARWNHEGQAPNVPPGTGTLWYRMVLTHEGAVGANFVFTSIRAAVSDSVKLKIVRKSGDTADVRSGTGMAMSERPVESRLIILPFEMGPGETVTAYVGIKSSFTRNLLYQIMPASMWRSYEFKSTVFFGFYFGFLTLILVVSLIMSVVRRQSLTAVYAFMCFVIVLSCANGMGFVSMLVPRDMAVPLSQIQVVGLPIMLLSVCWFSREYLEVKNWSRFFWWYFTMTMAVAMMMVVALSLGFQPAWVMAALDHIMSVGVLFSVLAGVVAVWGRKTRFAVSYLLGFSLYMVVAGVWTSQGKMMMPSTAWVVHGLFAMQIVQNIIFSVALSAELRRQMILGAKNNELVRYGETMSTFVRVLSHDLSNYLAIVDGGITLLEKDNLDPERRKKAVDRVRKSLEQQREVLDSVKELKALEDGKSEMKLDAVDVAGLLVNLSQTFESRLSAKGVTLSIASPAPGQLSLIADRKTLYHSVVCNLVSNAIKFSEAGKAIVINAWEGDDGMFISVTDAGIGMPPDLAAKVFKSDEKTSRVGTGGEKGTGFGLPICKFYMDLYGGSISVTSKPKETNPDDHGTTFTLRFKKA
jgi:signal transduction histidine kinase